MKNKVWTEDGLQKLEVIFTFMTSDVQIGFTAVLFNVNLLISILK